jgi:polyisoprenoid-binding protein YceI
VDIRIETASVESGSKTRNKHLRSGKFFWAGKHPRIHFISREFRKRDGMNFDIYGELTIRGITRPVVFKTEFLSEALDLEAGRPLRFRSQTHIKRKDFELGTGDWLDPILLLTDEILKISLEVQGQTQKL